MATEPKVKVELNMRTGAEVNEYVELYVPGCGHQRMNLTPDEAREVFALLMKHGYAPKDQVLVTLSRYELLLMAECGRHGHCDYKAGKVRRFPEPAAEHALRESLRDELLPFLQDYVDEELAKQNSATVEHVDMKLRAHNRDAVMVQLAPAVRNYVDEVVTKRVDEHTRVTELRLRSQVDEVVAKALASKDATYRELEKRILFGERYGSTTTAAAASSLKLSDIEHAAKLVDDAFVRDLLKAQPADAFFRAMYGQPVSTGQAAPKKERRLVSRSPVLVKHDQVTDWVDEDGTLWACDSVLRAKFPEAMNGAKRIRLMAYDMEGPHTVKVRPCLFNGHAVLVEEFNSQLGTTVMKEHDAHPVLVKWLNTPDVPQPAYVGVHTVERYNHNHRGTNDCKRATPVLHLDKGGVEPTWNDKEGNPWVCAQAIHELASWVKDDDTMQLLAFGTPSSPGMQRCVKLNARPEASFKYPLMLDGEEADSFDHLRDWLRQDDTPTPAYVTAHVVGKCRDRDGIGDRALACTDLLCTDADGDWMDEHDATWVCRDAVRRFAPHVDPGEEIRLVAFELPAKGRVKVEVVRSLIDKEQLKVNGNELGVFTALMDWVLRLAWNRPVYVEARVA